MDSQGPAKRTEADDMRFAESFEKMVRKALEENNVDSITFYKWQSPDNPDTPTESEYIIECDNLETVDMSRLYIHFC